MKRLQWECHQTKSQEAHKSLGRLVSDVRLKCVGIQDDFQTLNSLHWKVENIVNDERSFQIFVTYSGWHCARLKQLRLDSRNITPVWHFPGLTIDEMALYTWILILSLIMNVTDAEASNEDDSDRVEIWKILWTSLTLTMAIIILALFMGIVYYLNKILFFSNTLLNMQPKIYRTIERTRRVRPESPRVGHTAHATSKMAITER